MLQFLVTIEKDHMELTDIIFIMIAFLAAHFWWKTMQAREKAEKLVKIACQRENVQLLDGTVSLKKFGFNRSSNQGYYFVRYFGFEFSNQGDERLPGTIVMRENRQDYLIVDLPDNSTITVDENSDN